MARPIDLDQLMKYPLRRGSEHCDEKNADPRFLNGVESILEWAQTLPTITPPNEWISAEALREPDEPLKNGRSQEHFEKLRNLISDMSVVEIASHIETDNLSEYLGIWRYHAQKELLSIRQLFFEEDNP